MRIYETGIVDRNRIMIKEYDVINLFGGSGLEDLYIVKYSSQFQKFIYIKIEFYEECLLEKFYFKSTFDNRIFESDCRTWIDVEIARAEVIEETFELLEDERCKVLKLLENDSKLKEIIEDTIEEILKKQSDVMGGYVIPMSIPYDERKLLIEKLKKEVKRKIIIEEIL